MTDFLARFSRFLIIFVIAFALSFTVVDAQTRGRALESPAATTAATPDASTSAQLEEQRREENRNLTDVAPEVQNKLTKLLQETPVKPLSPLTFIQHAIRRAVNEGVPPNLLVLVLLFPVITAFIAASRHIIGLEGFGVYTPAVLAVTLVSTGIGTGLLLFCIILIAASVGRTVLRQFKLQYLPRTALMLWFVSLTVFGLLLVSPALTNLNINLVSVSIFPILMLVLLSENFIEAQLAGSQSRAIQLTLETMVLAVICAMIMRMSEVQRFVILYPELTIVLILLGDIAVGRYTGLRLSEFLRFKPIIDPEE